MADISDDEYALGEEGGGCPVPVGVPVSATLAFEVVTSPFRSSEESNSSA